MRTHSLAATALLLVLANVLAGCLGATAEPPAAASEAPAVGAIREATFITRDHAFEGPDTLEAGLVRLRLQNEGPSPHHLMLIRLAPGRTVQDLLDGMHGETPPAWARALGGPQAAAGDASVVLDLQPGLHVAVCLIPDAEGKMHLAHGMVKPVLVTPATTVPAPAPEADAEVRLLDFAFDFPVPAAGTRTLHVVNDGPQHHEIIVVRLQGNASVMDFVAAFAPDAQAPPPGEVVGGLTPMAPGAEAWLTLDLQPGRYGLVCFVGDEEGSGHPHLALGMVHEFTVA